jgi:serine/threonine protein phosphatase 1
MKFYHIQKPKSGNRWVIDDIHACKKTLQTLVEHKIGLTQEDQLFFLGDYINRGPDSIGVIDFIMNLQSLDYQVFTLRGNHEQMLLDSHYQSHSELELALPSLHKHNPLKDANRKILPQYVDFFENLPYYFELDGLLFGSRRI